MATDRAFNTYFSEHPPNFALVRQVDLSDYIVELKKKGNHALVLATHTDATSKQQNPRTTGHDTYK